MKILIAIHYFPPHLGGMEIVAKTQAILLAKQGHKVTVLTSAAPGPAGSIAENGYRLVRVSVWNYFEKAMGVPFPFFAPSLIWKSYKLVKNADVVHTHDAFYLSSLAVSFWAWVLRKPIVLTQHVDIIPHPKKIVNLVQRLVYKTTGKLVLTVSRRIAILNSTVERFLLSNGIAKEKIQLIPNGVDTELFTPGDPEDKIALRKKYHLPLDKPIALFVGRFVPKKGFDKLLQASDDAYHIAFAGGEAPVEHFGNPQFTFLGALPPQTLAEIYRAVDMFILPSQGEGFPLTVQEAMASGLPIIISGHPGYDVYNFDMTKLRFITPSVENIRQTLCEVASNTLLRQQMSEYSLQYARAYFSWPNNIQAMVQAYQEVQQA